MTEHVLELAAAYEARKILPRKFVADMRHIVLATIAEVMHSSVGTSVTW